MQYNLNSHLCGDFNVLEVNKLPARSYFIPFSSREQAKSFSPIQKRYHSPLVKVLNGTWDFIYYDNPNDLPPSLNTNSLCFDKIDVPSCWQFRGYGKPAYINLRYPFKYAPPRIPVNEPVKGYFSVLDGFKRAPQGEWNHIGLYRTFFNVEDLKKNYVLSFLGVASCMELYVNGSFIGYSEESHNTAEFDITNVVHEGSNEMVVLVRRWCNGSYLECQDMFRNNGIFRDVLLRISNIEHIWDLDFKTFKHDNLYDAVLTVTLSKPVEESKMNVDVSIEGRGLSIKKKLNEAEREGCNLIFTFKDLSVEQWNAEKPNLYDLYIETQDSCIQQRVGFKEISIKGRVFYVNGSPVKFKGVNHHDTSPKNGYYLSPEEIERDLRLCKEFNIDTVRTSHYAPDPLLLELASELGLYVVDEVDLETHGVYVQKLPPSMNWLSNNAKWKNRYLSRAKRHYNRDKILSTPVVMWSLGNESGDGCNTYAMYEYFKAVTSIPIHYESVVHAKRKAYDVASQMYPPVEAVKAVGEGTSRTKQFNDRPYFLCEYAHAMGVGPGNIEGYWKEIYSHESLMGGCVWEMFDHAVLHEDKSYTYGGDHGEWIHDGNFCVDGIFYPNRTPSTGAWIVRHAYRPLRVSFLGGSWFEVFNTTAFTSGDKFELKVKATYKTGEEVSFNLTPKVTPLGKAKIDLSTYIECETLKIIEFVTCNEKGIEVGIDQIELSTPILPEPESVESSSIEEFKKIIGEPSSILFRASTDNDKPLFKPNPMKKWYSQKEEVFEKKILDDGNLVVMSNILAVGNRFLSIDTYKTCVPHKGFDNAVYVTSLLHPVSAKGYLPRFGKTFKLDATFNPLSTTVRWYGRQKESYLDMKEQSPIGEYKGKVEDMTEPNIRPQESGNRCDVQWVEIENDSLILRFDAIKVPFELGIKPYSDLELSQMKHQKDEVCTGTYVTLSAFQQGIGTGSCGPYTLKEYMFSAKKDYELCFIISWKKK